MQVDFIFSFIQPDTHILDSVELEKIFFFVFNLKTANRRKIQATTCLCKSFASAFVLLSMKQLTTL